VKFGLAHRARGGQRARGDLDRFLLEEMHRARPFELQVIVERWFGVKSLRRAGMLTSP
jgi:hypothetical protein